MDGNAKQFRHFFYCIHMICLLILHYKWFELLEVKPFSEKKAWFLKSRSLFCNSGSGYAAISIALL